MDTKRIKIKGSLDSAAIFLLSIGGTGISFAIFNNNLTAGGMGIIATILGIGLIFTRHFWNEKSHDKREMNDNNKKTSVRKR